MNYFLPQDRTNLFYNIFTHQLEKRVRLVYEVRKGYATCKDEVFNVVDDIVDDETIANTLRDILQETRNHVMEELGRNMDLLLKVIINIRKIHKI